MLQALIYCQRYGDAAQQCKELLPGKDRLHLQAEIAWRSGQLSSSLKLLQSSEQDAKGVEKFDCLREVVLRLSRLEEACQQAREEGKALLFHWKPGLNCMIALDRCLTKKMSHGYSLSAQQNLSSNIGSEDNLACTLISVAILHTAVKGLSKP